MKLYVVLSLLVSSLAWAQGADAGAEAVRTAKVTVQSVKPLLMSRHVLSVRGVAQQMPVGGYQWKATPTFRADGAEKGSVQIALVGTAAGSAALVKGAPDSFKVEQQVEVPELKGRKGTCDIVVVDGSGAELFRTTLKL